MEFSDPYKILELISKRLESQLDEKTLERHNPRINPKNSKSNMEGASQRKHSLGI